MPRYHFNPATGRTGVCKAKTDKCPFILAGARHYETIEEARAGVEEFFTEKYTSLSGRLAVQTSRIQREIIQGMIADKDFEDQRPLIRERDFLRREIKNLTPDLEEDTPPLETKPSKMLYEKVNEDLGDSIVGFTNNHESLGNVSIKTDKAAFNLSERWVSMLKTEEVQVLLAYSSDATVAESNRELFDKALKKAPPLESTTVYSGLSQYVAKDVLSQLDSGIINLDYPISTSLNAAQANGFMRGVDDKEIAVEIETTTGASMLALSSNPQEFEILLPSGSYEVLETRKGVKLLWEKDGAGRTADMLIKLRRLS